MRRSVIAIPLAALLGSNTNERHRLEGLGQVQSRTKDTPTDAYGTLRASL
jgi:hypothetical protein